MILARSGDGVFNNYCQHDQACPARVGVVGFESTLYFIVAQSGNALMLPENTPINGFVEQGEANYYVFAFSGGDNAVIIELTPTSGDADLYARNDLQGSYFPSATNYTWASRNSRLRQEVIRIYPTLPKACPPGHPCNYFISVIGDDTAGSSYNLIIRTSDATPRPLTRGQIVTQSLNSTEIAFFELSFGPQATDTSAVTITVSPINGDPDLFASWGNDTLSLQKSDYKSNHFFGDDTIIVSRNQAPASQCSPTASCTLTILVYGWSNTFFTLTAKVSGSNQELIDGISLSDSAASLTTNYYMFTVSGPVPQVSISVTPLSGDPDLYVSHSVQTPGPSTPNTMHSAGFSYETIEILPSVLAQQCTPTGATAPQYPCLWYIGVRAAGGTAASWRILATTGVSVLSLGSPSIGTAPRGLVSYFQFHLPSDLPEGLGSVDISLTPITSSATLYVTGAQDRSQGGVVTLPTIQCATGNQPPCGPGNTLVSGYEYASLSSFGGQRVSMRDYVPGADYGIAVLAGDALGSPATCDFTLTVTSPSANRILESGVPVDGIVATGKYNYYVLYLTSNHADVVVTVTNYFGDADLYVSWHPNNHQPNSTSSDKQSLSSGDDSITIPSPDWMSQCSVINNPDGSVVPCAIFIGVRGFRGSMYSIVGSANASLPNLLIDGQPQGGFVAKGGLAYFRIPISLASNTDTFGIAVTSLSGDADLYVRNGQLPGTTPGTYDAAATSPSGLDLVTLGPQDRGYCSSDCTIFAMVYGWSDAEFQISYSSTGIVTLLRNGESQYSSGSEGTTQYYAVFVPAGSDTLAVQLTAISGDADIYMSVETTPDIRPNPQNGASWEATSYGTDSLSVPNPASYCPTPTSGCNFVIGIYSAEDSRFTIIASTSSTSVLRLLDGVPQQGVAIGTGSSYYFVQLPIVSPDSSQAVSITVATPSGATVNLFGTDLYNPVADPGTTGTFLPNATWNRYSTLNPTGQSTRTSIVVSWANTSPSDPPPRGPYVAIAVTGTSSGSNTPFVIQSSSSEKSTVLQLSRPGPVRYIQYTEMQHYTVNIPTVASDISFSLTMLSGDADIVVSHTNYYPSCRLTLQPGRVWDTVCTGTWKSLSSSSETLTISAANPCSGAFNTSCSPTVDFQPGQFYVGVFGASTARYTLTVSQSLPQQLTDGQPTSGVVSTTAGLVYMLFVNGNAAAGDVKFTVTRTDASGRPSSLVGSPLGVYIKACREDLCPQSGYDPTPTDNQASTLVSGSTGGIVVGSNSAAHCTPYGQFGCVYFATIAPVCSSGSPSCTTQYQLTGSSQAGISFTTIDFRSVENDVFVTNGVVPDGINALYELFLQPESGTSSVMLSLEACGPGLPSLFVCDPVAEDGAKKCNNAVAPSKNDYSFAASTANAPVGGRASVYIPSSHAAQLFFSVDATNPSRRLALDDAVGGTTPVEVFRVMASVNGSYYLAPSGPTSAQPGTLSIGPGADGVSVDVSWSGATLMSADGSSVLQAKGVRYGLVARQGGFASSGVVASSACGLQLLAGVPNAITRLSDFDVTSLTIGGLAPNAVYGINVYGTCDAGCFSSSLASPTVLQVRDASGAMRSVQDLAEKEMYLVRDAEALARHMSTRGSTAWIDSALQHPEGSQERRSLLSQAGSQTQEQSIAFKMGSITTGAAPPQVPQEGLTSGAVVAISVIGSAVVVGGVGFWWYRRRHARDFTTQYIAFKAEGAMDTLPEPLGAYSAMDD
jgi:hypothetical protein